MSPDNLLVTGIQEGDYIKNQTASATYYTATGWYGNLSELSPQEMYMIRLQGPDCSIAYEGQPLDLLALPIPLASGWNWVGYPRQYEMPLPQAMASLNPEYGDYIKNQLVSSTFYDNYGWFGTMETMLPGDGYKFRKNTAEELVYPPEGPSGVLSMKGSRSMSEDKGPDPHMFQFNGSLTAQVWLDGSAVAEEGDRLLAYVNGEFRGSAAASWFEPTGCWIFPLMAYTNSSEGESLEFKFFESSSDLTYACEETMVLFPDMVEADALHPFILNVNTATGIEDPAMLEVLSLEVFPNPSSGPVQIEYALESAGEVRITAYDMMGRFVRELGNTHMERGSHRITWDMSDYPAGTYIIEMKSGKDVLKAKVLLTK